MKRLAFWTMIAGLLLSLLIGGISCTETTGPSPTPMSTAMPGPSSTPTPTALPNGSVVVVAAYNASSKSGADYLCDGTDDQVQIQKAINSGKAITLTDGTFNLSGELSLSSNLFIDGQGNKTTLVFSTKEFLIADGANPVTLEDISVRSTTGHGGIYMRHCSNVKILNCTFDGLLVQITGGTTPNDYTTIDTDNVLVQYCTFMNSPRGIGNFALGNAAKNFRILDNYFYNVNVAVDVSNSPYAVVSGNTIDGAYNDFYSGIYSEGGQGISFTDNTIRNCPKGAAIMVAEGEYGYGKGGDGLIDGNTIGNCDFGVGIFGTPRMTVSNNTIAVSRYGVWIGSKAVYGTTYYPTGTRVLNNSITSGSTQVYVEPDCSGCLVTTPTFTPTPSDV